MRKIIIDPAVCDGRPIFEGTRIAVQTILEFLSAGDTIEDVLREYPALSLEDVLATDLSKQEFSETGRNMTAPLEKRPNGLYFRRYGG